MPLWINLLLFESGWLLLVIAGNSLPSLLILPMMVLFCWGENREAPVPASQYAVRGIIALIGILCDQLFSIFRLIDFGSDNHLIPFWLVLLWCWFSLTFPACFRWINFHRSLAIVIAGIGGPAAYWGCTRLTQGEVEVLRSVHFSLLSGLFWMCLFAFIIYFQPFNKALFGAPATSKSL